MTKASKTRAAIPSPVRAPMLRKTENVVTVTQIGLHRN